MPKCYILSGIPCSGKSSWASKQGIPILSCDKIREELWGTPYKFNKKKEDMVWSLFYQRVIMEYRDFIIDNTNCKQSYINKIKDHLRAEYEIEIKRFDCSLSKAYIRNVLRYLKCKKWIPFKVIKNMKKNYDKLWKISI